MRRGYARRSTQRSPLRRRGSARREAPRRGRGAGPRRRRHAGQQPHAAAYAASGTVIPRDRSSLSTRARSAWSTSTESSRTRSRRSVRWRRARRAAVAVGPHGPPTPSSVPPNQRVTTATTSPTPRPRSASSMGAPAVPAARRRRRRSVPAPPPVGPGRKASGGAARPSAVGGAGRRQRGRLVLDPLQRAEEPGPLDLDLGGAVAGQRQVREVTGAPEPPGRPRRSAR